jgi:hypothetical protein
MTSFVTQYTSFIFDYVDAKLPGATEVTLQYVRNTRHVTQTNNIYGEIERGIQNRVNVMILKKGLVKASKYYLHNNGSNISEEKAGDEFSI